MPNFALQTRKDAGVVDRGGLENRCALTGTQGSNPCLSANKQIKTAVTQKVTSVLIFITYKIPYNLYAEHRLIQMGRYHRKSGL